MELFIFVLEIIGTIAFACFGAMNGIGKNMDILGVSILGMTTAVGGGIIRDLILGINPPHAFRNPTYAIVSIVVSVIIFVLIKSNRSEINRKRKFFYEKILFFLDSIGLGIFTVVGVNVAFNNSSNSNLFLLIFVGVITGVGGGVLQDVMAGNTPYIFVKHIYASASILGATVCSVLWPVMGKAFSMLFGAILIVIVRILAAHFKWNLPRVENPNNDSSSWTF